MSNFKGMEDLVGKLSAAIPSPLRDLHHDLEDNLKSTLESGLHKMNLVTREEFDVQSAVLAKTRAKVDQLAAQVSILEAHLQAQGLMPNPPSTAKATDENADTKNTDPTSDNTTNHTVNQAEPTQSPPTNPI
ncbi:MAG TPA: accessory factor UbiK family protein [Thiothrix sp.]|nr:accessory factor UbiK family protein [Thiothrix sp.]